MLTKAIATKMAYLIRIGTGSIIATLLFIPLFIILMIFVPVLIVAILFMAAAVSVASVLTSKVKKGGRGRKGRKMYEGKVIDAEYRIK
jgi:hypothetical protein